MRLPFPSQSRYKSLPIGAEEGRPKGGLGSGKTSIDLSKERRGHHNPEANIAFSTGKGKSLKLPKPISFSVRLKREKKDLPGLRNPKNNP